MAFVSKGRIKIQEVREMASSTFALETPVVFAFTYHLNWKPSQGFDKKMSKHWSLKHC